MCLVGLVRGGLIVVSFGSKLKSIAVETNWRQNGWRG